MSKSKKISYRYFSLGKVIRDLITKGWDYCIEYITCPTFVKFTRTFHVVIYILFFGILNGPPLREWLFEWIDSTTIGGWLISNLILTGAVYVVSKHIISRTDLTTSVGLIAALSVAILGQRPAWELIEKKKTK